MIRSNNALWLMIIITTSQSILKTRLPDNFYLIDKTGTNNLVNGSIQPRAFYIVVGVPTALPSKNPSTYQALLSLVDTKPVIPAGYCPALPSSGPIISLYFNWEDKVGFKNVRDFGAIFAKGITELTSLFDVPSIIVSFGKGGLLVNYASRLWNSSTPLAHLPTIIQVGTPIPQPTSQYSDLMPGNAIQRFFYFYSNQPFVFDQSTLQPQYQTTYDTLPKSMDVYKIVVLFNNKQPLQNQLATMPLLTQGLLSYTASAQTNYRINRNLFLSLSTIKSPVQGLIGIAQPHVMQMTLQAQQELVLSNNTINSFISTWGMAPATTLSQGEIYRNTHKFSGNPINPPIKA